MSRDFSFPLQLSAATLVVGAVVAGLYWLGHRNAEPNVLPPTALAPSSVSSAPSPLPSPEKPAATVSPRELLPSNAWLVADFDGTITGSAPFDGQLSGPCAQIPPPARVGIAVLSAASDNPSLRLMLAAPRVSQDFWNCTAQAVAKAGGRKVGSARGFEVLQSQSGILVRSPDDHLVFGTGDTLLTTALSILRGSLPSAKASGPHPELEKNLNGNTRTTNVLSLTAHLPPDWLDAAGPGAIGSPLRYLRAAALVGRADGSAIGAIHCSEPGCTDLAKFLDRARTDLATELPPDLARAARESLDARLVPGPPGGLGRIALTWAPTGVALTRVVSHLLGLGDGSVLGSPPSLKGTNSRLPLP